MNNKDFFKEYNLQFIINNKQLLQIFISYKQIIKIFNKIFILFINNLIKI